MSHAPLGSLNSVGGVATEVNSVNYVSTGCVGLSFNQLKVSHERHTITSSLFAFKLKIWAGTSLNSCRTQI